MPMLAELDDPPRSRWPGFLVGLLVALPFAAAIAWALLPFLYGQLTGGAEDFDARLRQEDAYMQGLCTDAMLLARDEELCECALAIEFPSLDCRPQFMAWTLARQQEQCAQPELRAEAVSFCACVEAVAENADEAADGETSRKAIQRYTACTELDDAMSLPTLDALRPSPEQLAEEQRALAADPGAKL